jgi:glucokinase
MRLGIEIGGTKLQLGVGHGDEARFVAFERRDVDPSRGAAGILEQIAEVGRSLLRRHNVSRIGIGFGGPVDPVQGQVIKSHQVDGWDGFPLVRWCEETLQRPARLGNDCDVAALAEARFGAGRGHRVVFYVTVGTGIGGGLVLGGQSYGSEVPPGFAPLAVAEIGHLRPGLESDDSAATVESLASGRGIEHAARQRLAVDDSRAARDLLERCPGGVSQLTARIVATAAAEGNELACDVMAQACRTLGWAIAQVVTLLAPNVVVIGGGVSLIGHELFFAPVAWEVQRYVFPPLAGSFQIVPAGLGEEVVVHGAVALAG